MVIKAGYVQSRVSVVYTTVPTSFFLSPSQELLFKIKIKVSIYKTHLLFSKVSTERDSILNSQKRGWLRHILCAECLVMHTQFKRGAARAARNRWMHPHHHHPLFLFFFFKTIFHLFRQLVICYYQSQEGRVKNENGIQLVTTRRLYPSLSAVSWV